jgi:hypothetical protein
MVDKIKKGWAWPSNSRKAHYFYDTRSLCGRMAFFGPVEGGNDESPDNCAECKKRFTKMKPNPVPAA